MKTSEVEELIEVALLTPMSGWPGEPDCIWGLPALVWGEPGIGKTARVKQIAKRWGIRCEPVFCGQHPPEDFSGALIPDGKGGASSICAIDAVRELIDEGVGILCLDEINQATKATMGAAMAVSHERRAGGKQIPGRVRILSCANPEKIATGGRRLSPALANRYLHIEDDGPTEAEYTAYRMRSRRAGVVQTKSLKTFESKIISEWSNMIPKVDGLWAGFLSKFPQYRHIRPEVNHPDSGRAWPSHRTNEYAEFAMATCLILDKGQIVKDALMEAIMGEQAAEALITYQKEANLPDALDMLTNGWEPDEHRHDRTLAAYAGMVSYVTGRGDRKDQLKLAVPCWEMLEQLIKPKGDRKSTLADLVIPCVDALVESQLARNSGDEKVIAAAQKVFVPMGLSGLSKFMDDDA